MDFFFPPFSTNNFLYHHLFFFRLPMEVYKPATFLQTLFSQTPLLPSSLFQDLIENFPCVGWKKLQMLDVLSPSHRSRAPLTALLPDLLLCSLFSLGLTPSLLLFSEVLFLCFSLNTQPRKQEAKEKCGCVSKHPGSPLNPLVAVLSPFLSLSLVPLAGLNFYLSSFVFCLLQLLEPETALFQQLQRWYEDRVHGTKLSFLFKNWQYILLLRTEIDGKINRNCVLIWWCLMGLQTLSWHEQVDRYIQNRLN